MSDVSHYCYLLHERNEINRLRRRLGAKKNILVQGSGKDEIAKMAYLSVEEKYRDCQILMGKHKNMLAKMAKQLGIKNDWGGKNGTARGIWMNNIYYSHEFILEQHKSYIIECIIMGIEIVNIYHPIKYEL